MASTKTIRLKIALDGEREFKAAMQAVKKESSLLKTELKNLDEKYRGNANSLEALEAKQKTLAEAQETYTKRVKAASEGLENAKKNETEQAQRLEDLRDKLEEAKKAMEAMEKAGDTTSEAYKEQQKRVDELSQAVKDQIVVYSKTEGAVSDWRKELSTANHNLEECNEEITKNDKYLEEARQSADHCATSIDKYGDEVGEAATESEKLSVSLGDMVKNKVVDILGDALMEMGQKAIEAAKYVLEVGSSFEAQMDKVAAISGATGSDLDKLTKKAQEMGATTKFSATESAEALEYMAMAGWKTNDMIDGLEGIMNLAAASGEDLATTSDIVTDALTAFGQTSKESGRLADIMAAASSNANTNVGMMGETFKYAAPVAGALGYSMEDTALAIGLMANSGIKASSAGTALRSGLTRLAAPTKQVKEAMDKYGISLTDTDGKMLSFRDLMVQLREKLGGLSEVEQTAAVSALAGKNAMSGWLAIINGSDADFDKLAGAIDNSNGSAERMAETMQDNLAGKLKILESALEGLGLAVYNYVSGPLQSVVEFVTGIISGITEAISPQRTELESFIDDIQKANDEVESSIDSAKKTVNNAEVKVAELETAKTFLSDLLNGCGEFNRIDLSPGRYKILDATGAVVAEGFEPIPKAIDAVWESMDGLDVDSFIAKFSTDQLATFCQAVESAGDVTIKTGNVKEGTAVIVECFNDAGGKVKDYTTAVTDSGEVKLDTDGITEPVTVVVSAVDSASGSVQEFRTRLDGMGKPVDVSPVIASLEKIEEPVLIIKDELTKAKLDTIFGVLSEAGREFDDVWDSATGTIKGNKEEILNWIDAAQEVAMQTALQDAMTSLYRARADALVNLAKANGAVAEAEKAAAAEVEQNNAALDKVGENYGAISFQSDKAQKALKKAQKEQEKANATFDEASAELDKTAEALAGLNDTYFGTAEATEETKKTAEEAAGAVDNLGDESEEASEQVEKLTEKQQEAITALGEFYNATTEDLAGIQEKLESNGINFGEWAEDVIKSIEEVKDEYDELYEKVNSSIEGMLNSWSVAGETQEEQVSSFLEGLYKQREELNLWVESMKTLGEMVNAGEFSQELYDEFLQAGAKGNAGLVAGLAGDPEAAKTASLYFTDNIVMASEDTETLMRYSGIGKRWGSMTADGTVEGLNARADAFIDAGQTEAENIGAGLASNSQAVIDEASGIVTEATDSATTEAENAKDTGETMGDRTKEGIESTKQEVKEATEGMIEDARLAGETIASEFHRVGQIIPQKIKQGINEANGMGVGPTPAIEALMQNASNAVSNYDQNFWNSGWNSAVAVGNGINAGAQNAINAAINLANAVNNAYNSTLQIHSPSLVMEKSGVHTVEGVEQGFEKETPRAVQKARETAEAVTEAYDQSAEKKRQDKLVENLNLSIIKDSADTMTPIASLTDHAMGAIGSTMDRTQAAIAKMTADLGKKLDSLAEALNVIVYADFGADRFDARTVRVVKQAISRDNKALKASKGR